MGQCTQWSRVNLAIGGKIKSDALCPWPIWNADDKVCLSLGCQTLYIGSQGLPPLAQRAA